MVVSNHGIQFSIGPTYNFHTKPILGELTASNGARGNYSITPKSQLGIYAEFGMVHFPKWKGTPIIISLVEGAKPFWARPYPVPLKNCKVFKEELNRQCRIGAL